MTRICRRSRSQKESAELLFTEHPLQFPEGEEWNESAKYDETAAEEIIDSYLAQCCCHIFSMDKKPNQFLNNVKRECEQSKQKRLMNGCQKQWLGLMFPPKVSVFTYENDFGDYEGIDEREAISEMRDAKLLQQKHAVGREGAKEKS